MTKSSLKSFYDLVHYTDEDGYEHFLPLDYVSGGVLSASHQENTLFKGQKFAAWGIQASTAIDGAYDIVLRTPAGATAYTHLMKIEGWVDGGQCRLQLLETPTTATSDTAFTPVNQNRLSTDTSGVEIETSATVTVGAAVQVDEKVFGGGTSKKGDLGAGAGPGVAQYILDTSTTYVIRALNKSADSSTVSIRLTWAEHSRGIET